MRNTRNNKRILLTISLIASIGAANAYNTYRHIYNNTNYTWTIKFSHDSWATPQQVNIYNNPQAPHKCIGNNDDPIVNGDCVVAPNVGAIDITYDADGIPEGTVTITDSCNQYQDYAYEAKDGGVYIKHTGTGNTGGVSLNDPTDGDIKIIGKCLNI